MLLCVEFERKTATPETPALNDYKCAMPYFVFIFVN